MAITNPIDHGGFRLLEGWQGQIKTSGSDDGHPWEAYFPQTVPISGSSNYELHVFAPVHSSSLTASSGFSVWGSASDGSGLKPIGAVPKEDGSGMWALATDTELVLSGNIVVSNVKVFSTTGLSSSLVYARAQAGTDYPFGIPVSVSGNFLAITDAFHSGAAYVTSSNDSPIYSALVALSGAAYFTASIDAYNDLHTYDWRASASIIQVSGAVSASTEAIYQTSGSIVALYKYLTDISGTVIQVSGAVSSSTEAIYQTSASIAATYQYLTDISGTVIQVSGNIDQSNLYLSFISSSTSCSCEQLSVYLPLISSSINTSLTILSTSISESNNYLVAISGAVVDSTSYLASISSSISQSNTYLLDISGAIGSVSSSVASSNTYLNAISGGMSTSFDYSRFIAITSMFPYQLGIDAGSCDNAATSTTVNIYGITAITGNTICPFIYNCTTPGWHFVDTTTVTTASFTVSPAIPVATSSLIIKYNATKLSYNPLANAYNIYQVNPSYFHAIESQPIISESNGPIGLTSSVEFYTNEYSMFCLSFYFLVNASCSISATLDPSTTTTEWISLTEDLCGGATVITSSCLVAQDAPIRYNRVKVAFSKSTNSTNNGILVRLSQYND